MVRRFSSDFTCIHSCIAFIRRLAILEGSRSSIVWLAVGAAAEAPPFSSMWPCTTQSTSSASHGSLKAVSQEGTNGRLGLRSSIISLPPLSISQSKSWGQARFKKNRERYMVNKRKLRLRKVKQQWIVNIRVRIQTYRCPLGQWFWFFTAAHCIFSFLSTFMYLILFLLLSFLRESCYEYFTNKE